VDDGLERLEDELAIDEEPEVTIDGGLPLGDGRLHGRLVPPVPGLVPGVQPHGRRPHLLDKRGACLIIPSRSSSRDRRRRRRHRDQAPLRRGRNHGRPRPEHDGHHTGSRF